MQYVINKAETAGRVFSEKKQRGSSVHAAFWRILVSSGSSVSIGILNSWCFEAQEPTDEAKPPQAWHCLRQLLLFFCLLGRWRVLCQSPGCVGCILRCDEWLVQMYLFVIWTSARPCKITSRKHGSRSWGTCNIFRLQWLQTRPDPSSGKVIVLRCLLQLLHSMSHFCHSFLSGLVDSDVTSTSVQPWEGNSPEKKDSNTE